MLLWVPWLGGGICMVKMIEEWGIILSSFRPHSSRSNRCLTIKVVVPFELSPVNVILIIEMWSEDM